MSNLFPSTQPQNIQPWPTEKILTLFVWIVSLFVWVALAVSMIGIVYVLFIALFIFIGHLIFVSHVRGNSVRLGPNQFPELFATVERLSKKLGLEQTPEAYLMQAGGMLNALATKFLRSNMIVLYSDLLEACKDNAQARDMIIGHELGHLKAGHLKFHWFLLPGYFFPFLGMALSRAREYTCDRYGMAATDQDEKALRGLAILAAGAEHGPQVNLQALAHQAKNLNTGFMTLGEWLSTHPPLAKRVIALKNEFRPRENYTKSGRVRALAILSLLIVVPMILMVGIMSLVIPKLKQQAMDALPSEAYQNFEEQDHNSGDTSH